MPPQAPGFNVSLLRQRTFARRNQPVTVSGRVTAFGLGVPALVRVFLEGPSHDPQVRSFDTLAAPVSGDYAIPVLAEKDGRYTVYAHAFPPLGIPLPGAQAAPLGPPLAESPRPPLAVGEPVDGELEQELRPGERRRVAPPAPTPVEVSAPITFAPRIEVPVRRVARPAPPPVPAAPPEPAAPAEVVIAPQAGGRITGFEIEE